MGMILNLDTAPADPIERLVWLGGVMEQVTKELDAEFAEAYFWSRLTGRLDAALALKIHSAKKVMAFTRHENQNRGRTIRWGDGRS